jgi:hypothetical protein
MHSSADYYTDGRGLYMYDDDMHLEQQFSLLGCMPTYVPSSDSSVCFQQRTCAPWTLADSALTLISGDKLDTMTQ